MAGLSDLMREYERTRFPAHRRLDLHGEGPQSARDRALHWIQSRAHEEPGEELLLIVERVVRPGKPPAPVAVAVRKLLTELEGRLIAWWQPFGPGSLALRLSTEPRMHPFESAAPPPEGEGRTSATAGSARPQADEDIPPELLPSARRATDLRLEREGLSVRVHDVVLREIWIEVQAMAMERRIPFEAAMGLVLEQEEDRLLDDTMQ